MKSDISKVIRTTESVGFPDVVLIDNFNGCNLKCSMCDHKSIRKYRRIQRMDWGLYTKLVDEIAVEKPEARVWQIFFGEPFLCSDMPKRIKYAKDQGLKNVVLNTNGVLMTYEKAKAVIDAGLDEIHVGVDAFRESNYKQIRVGGSFWAVVVNTLNYKDILEKVGRNGQRVYVQFVEDDLNEGDLEDFKRFWRGNGVNVKIRPKVSWGGLISATNLTAENQKARKPCYWLMRAINICADGSVALCSCDVHCRIKCGDANKSSIRELWDGQLADYRAMHREGMWKDLPEMCRDCRDWQSTYSETMGDGNGG